ncbi:MAG: type V CRISPR-associated protein Cas12a/Cpf1 [Bacteroidetes bacterium]|nr:type V CRISPR-associated protein Cas12a/Cpf1 [Bacteroidota bacterium]
MKNFVNKYSLSKTLRFELKPVGSNGKLLNEDEATEIFKKIIEQDRKVKAAYTALKPVIDKIHEDIINTSLTSEEVKQIGFADYFEEYKKGKAKMLNDFEKSLREQIGKAFEDVLKSYAVKKISKKKEEEEKSVFEFKKSVPIAKAEIIDYLLEQHNDDANLVTHIKEFKGFFGYFKGYNTNRANYYEYKKEADTSVATRIIHENLPKFCDNAIQFESKKDDYTGAYQFLKANSQTTQIKDAETNAMIEAEAISEDWFKIEKFSECLTQNGIDAYNRVIGHYNLLINLYNQARNDEKDFRKIPQFKTLFKQIGSAKRVLFEQIESDEELKAQLETLSNAGGKYFKESTDINQITIQSFTKWLKENDDWDGVYWSKAAVDKISNKYLANWHEIKDRIQTILQGKDKEQKDSLKSVATYKKNREEELKINDAVELSGLFKILNQQIGKDSSKAFFKQSVLEEQQSLIDENKTPSQNLINLICCEIELHANNFNGNSTAIFEIKDYKNEENIKTIKDWLDFTKQILWSVKYFDVKQNKIKGNSPNSELSNILSTFLRNDNTDWFNWYDLVRNYLSKKPQDDAKKNKLKLNFLNANLLGGWSDGEEKNKGAVLLKNVNKKYVGILIERNIFDTKKKKNPVYSESATDTGRLILRNLAFKTLTGKGFNGMFNGQKYSDIGKTNPLGAIYNLQKFISEYVIKKDKITYAEKYPLLKNVLEKKYTDKKTFDKEVQDTLTQCYENDFVPINWREVLKFVEQEKMYLFEIYSKDFSETKGEKSKNSNVNLQTKYWEHIFQKNSTIQLNGGGEIFFRGKVDLKEEDKAIHPANEKINRRSDGKKESIFKHEIIKNKRFTTEKFFFHIPIKINYQEPSYVYQGKVKDIVSPIVNDEFSKSSDIQFLGIDRGEKHLVYYSLVNKNGEILSQGHFDTINNKNYLDEINNAAKKRKEKQENWQQKGNISNLKDGYISLVVHEILEKMKDKEGNYKPTFIVLEDLNPGFKRGRQKFEQQVYQKFELALAKKLNYLVDKKASIGAIGSVPKALQLAPPVSNYGEIENKKQVGIMLYTRANYTSVTDPATGWRKTIYLKTGSEEDIKKQILNSFTEIGIENNDYYFQYTDANGKEWKLWSGKDEKSLERYRFKRGNSKNEPTIESYDVKALLDKLFEKFDKTKPLKQQLESGIELTKVNEHTAWETLRFVIDIIQQIRNSGDTTKKQDDNFLQSPVRNDEGNHFDSKNFKDVDNAKLPKDADANGAFNIARKGIVMYEHIRGLGKNWNKKVKIDGNETIDLDLFVSDQEWDLWLTNREQWQNKLAHFSSRSAKEESKVISNKKIIDEENEN